jgi:uncharacterized protein YndB with AHSA1/START domain
MKWVIRILGGLAGLLLLGVVVLFAMSHRATAGKMENSIELNAPPERVWAWVTEPDKLTQWVSWLVEVRGPRQQCVWVMRDENNGGRLMEIHSTVVEDTPPHRFRARLSAAEGFDGDATYEISDLGSGRTRLDIQAAYTFSHWFARLMEPVIMPSAGKKMVGDLARRKSKVEGAR